MQIVINIPKYYYENNIKNDLPLYLPEDNIIAILPKGHGRLKDVDALINTLGASDRDIYCKAVIEEDAPTIIEADTESEG